MTHLKHFSTLAVQYEPLTFYCQPKNMQNFACNESHANIVIREETRNHKCFLISHGLKYLSNF
jgi:hypothetical protein